MVGSALCRGSRRAWFGWTRSCISQDPLFQCLLPVFSTTRSLATEARLPGPLHSPTSLASNIDPSTFSSDDTTTSLESSISDTPSMSSSTSSSTSSSISSSASPFLDATGRRLNPFERNVLATVYGFPSFEPLRFAEYSSDHLDVPLRRDILQRAVIFEADNARQGTASSLWRSDINGSGRKLRPQKGTGQARLGDRSSPMLRGGAAAHGPKPRDFATKLNRKVYDLAWRVALSYRYRHGELIIVQKFDDAQVTGWRWMEKFMAWNHLGKPSGRSLFITRKSPGNLTTALNTGPKASGGIHGTAMPDYDVDVKDLLSHARLIVEKRALDQILRDHSSTLNRTMPAAIYND